MCATQPNSCTDFGVPNGDYVKINWVGSSHRIDHLVVYSGLGCTGMNESIARNGNAVSCFNVTTHLGGVRGVGGFMSVNMAYALPKKGSATSGAGHGGSGLGEFVGRRAGVALICVLIVFFLGM